MNGVREMGDERGGGKMIYWQNDERVLFLGGDFYHEGHEGEEGRCGGEGSFNVKEGCKGR